MQQGVAANHWGVQAPGLQHVALEKLEIVLGLGTYAHQPLRVLCQRARRAVHTPSARCTLIVGDIQHSSG
jgi:hypothetical protein